MSTIAMGEQNSPRTGGWDQYSAGRLLSRNRLIFYHHRLVMEYFLSYFYRLPTDLKALDVGCGDGFFLESLRNLGFMDVQGIDASQPFVDICRSKGLKVEPGSVYQFPGDAVYDAVLCCEVLEHLNDPGLALERIKGVLSDRGFIFVTVPIAASLQKRWRRLAHGETALGQLKQIDGTHRHVFTVRSFKDMAAHAGLSASSFWVGSNPFPFDEFLKRHGLAALAHWLQRRTFLGTCGDCLAMVLAKGR
ncbi:MAG: class I SAM-dependent methyltransferase [Candidatus Edwardsbacteria bacterium]|nr:class I SAM-dependent methyltransferase [Candidatus Edwardsbacteria bacterium]